MNKIKKQNLPSRHVSLGPKSSPHRSYYYAMGMTEKEIYQPFVELRHVGMSLHHAIFLFLVKLNQQRTVSKTILELPESLLQLQLLTA